MQTLPVTPEENAFLDRVSGCPRDPADPYGCEHYRVHGSHAFSGGLCNDCGFQRPIERGEQETTTRFYVAYFSESSRDPRRFPSIAAAVREFRDDVNQDGQGHADLYGPFDSEDHWADAERFTGIGCPFDGIDVRLTVGPRGGVLQERG